MVKILKIIIYLHSINITFKNVSKKLLFKYIQMKNIKVNKMLIGILIEIDNVQFNSSDLEKMNDMLQFSKYFDFFLRQIH